LVVYKPWPDGRFLNSKMGDGGIKRRHDGKSWSKNPGERAPRCIEEHGYIFMTFRVNHI